MVRRLQIGLAGRQAQAVEQQPRRQQADAADQQRGGHAQLLCHQPPQQAARRHRAVEHHQVDGGPRPRTQLGSTPCAAPLSVVSAMIQPAPSTNSSTTASHCGGASDRAAITTAVSTAASSTSPSALSRWRRRGSAIAPRIAPAPTAPSSTP